MSHRSASARRPMVENGNAESLDFTSASDVRSGNASTHRMVSDETLSRTKELGSHHARRGGATTARVTNGKRSKKASSKKKSKSKRSAKHSSHASSNDANGENASRHARDSVEALTASVLVLNRFYLAVHVVNVRRAFTLLYRQLAEVLDVEDDQYCNYDFQSWVEMSELRADMKQPVDDWIRSVSFEIQVPRVIRLLRYDRVPRYTMRFNRRNLFARDGHRCQYCGTTPPSPQLSLDHVMPRSRGGDNSWENVVCCCVRCNTRKGGRTPQEARMQLLRPPRKPTQSPILTSKLRNPKYHTWKAFVAHSGGKD